MLLKNINRWQAFGIHLTISFIIFAVLFIIIRFFWYPDVFINFGGWRGIKIVAGVDLVLGPLLTLIVYNAKKKSLPFDLAVIGLLQLGCLSYGVWSIEQQRPLTQVILGDYLYVVPKAQYKAQNIPLQAIKELPGKYPKKIMLDLENDHAAIARQVVIGNFTEKPLHLQTEKYITIDEDTQHSDRLNWILNRLTKDETLNCYWLPAESSYHKAELCFNIQQGAVDIKPITQEKISNHT